MWKKLNLVIDFTERGPKSQKGDQKGTSFCQKSPKGTFPLLGDLLVYSGSSSKSKKIQSPKVKLKNLVKRVTP